MPQVKEIPKFWCNYCFVVKDEKKVWFSCNRERDLLVHNSKKKHMKNYLALDDNLDKVICKECNLEMTKEAFIEHKKRNQRLWILKKAINPHLKCDIFQWSKSHRRFGSVDTMIKNKEQIDNTERKKPDYKKKGLVNTFSYLKCNENKSIEQKEEEIEKQLKDEEKYEECPDLELCVDCSNHSKQYYFNPDGLYTGKHLSLFDMEDCGCRYEDD